MPAVLPDRQEFLAGISGLTADSRAVQPGWLFAALQGAKADGRKFIGQALDQGAAAILTDMLPEAQAAMVRARAPRAPVERSVPSRSSTMTKSSTMTRRSWMRCPAGGTQDLV